MMIEEANIYSSEEEAKNNNQYLFKKQLQDLIESSKERYENFIKCCISKQIKVLEGIFYFIIKSIKQIDAWESLIYDIVQISETQLSHLQSHFDRIDNNLLSSLKDEQIDQRRELDDIIFYTELDLEKQKKSPLQKQLQSLKSQLKDMKNVLKLKKDNINEYFLKMEEQQEIEAEIELTEEQKEILYALEIYQKDLFEEFGVNDTIRTQQDDIDDEGNQDKKSEFYYKIQQGLIQMRLQDQERAQELFEQAIQLDPNNPKAYHCKANSHSLQHQHQEAIECYEKALELDPNYEECYLNHVRNMYKSLHIHKGEAEELLISIKEKFPNCKKVQHIVEFQKLKKRLNNLPQEDKFD